MPEPAVPEAYPPPPPDPPDNPFAANPPPPPPAIADRPKPVLFVPLEPLFKPPDAPPFPPLHTTKE